MKYRYMLLLMLTASFVLVTMCANAAVVTVTPESMQGWNINTYWNGEGAICAYGPAASENSVAFQTEDGTNLGKGAFYAACAYGIYGASSKDLSTVWLGNDMHNGQSLAGKTLSSITKMDYYSYMSKSPTDSVVRDTGWDSWKQNWWNPFQPIQLQITAENPNPVAPGEFPVRRTFAYRPWGGTSLRGDPVNENGRGIWQHFNAFASGRWSMHPDYADYQEVVYDNWAAVVAAYGSWKLVATNTSAPWKSAGWKGNNEPGGRPWSTGTGKCLNFEIGARHATSGIYFPPTATPSGTPIVGGQWNNWGSEGTGFRGHMDMFTLGINGVDETYNFEPSASAQSMPIVQATNKAVASSLVQQNPATKNLVLFKIAGKVLAKGNSGAEGFPWGEIDDGSGAIIRVYNINPLATVGNYYSAWGYAEWPRWTADPNMKICLWTHKTHVEELHDVVGGGW